MAPARGKQLPGSKRHSKTLKDPRFINKPAIKRISLRAGTKRLTARFADDTRDEIFAFLKKLLHNSIIVCSYNRRKTVQTDDVLFALKLGGQRMYTTSNS